MHAPVSIIPQSVTITSFHVGKLSVASIVKDDRVEPPWVVTIGLRNGWKDEDLRFPYQDRAMKYVLGELQAEEVCN